jgi:transposase
MAARKKDAGKGAAPGSPAASSQRGDDGAEVAGERVEVVVYAAAIDVAKGSGMVCTRVPGSRPGRKRQTVWQVDSSYASVVALMDHLRCQGIQRLVLESTSDYWRIWYYLAEAAGLQVWLVSARDVRHLPGRGKSDREDCVWLCKLNERGMLRRSFVPPEAIRDLRSLTRTRSRLAQDQIRHQNRVEKVLEDALLKISVVISDLFGSSGRRFPGALVAGETSPAALAALGDRRLKATQQQLADALTGRFREVHAFEVGMHLRLIDTINDEIARLDARIEEQLASIPGVAPACTACGLIGGGHAPGCAGEDESVLGLVERLDEITGVGARNARVLIAELGTDMSVFPTAGHAAAWARLTPRTLQSGATARPGRTGKGNPYLRGALGQCVMAAARTDTRLGEQYRRTARRRGKQKGIVAVSRTICEIAYVIIGDRAARFSDLGAGHYGTQNPQRQTRSRIREIERLNPGMKVTLTPIEPVGTAA